MAADVGALALPLADAGGVTSVEFRAMGSDAHVLVLGGPAHLGDRARARIDDLESRWSRFRPDSDLSRLNAAAGRPVAIAPVTAALLLRAVDAWRVTGGRFDPTILPALRDAGYDRTFTALHAPDPWAEVAADDDLPARPAPGLGGLELTPGHARLPRGVEIDPGGIGKGLAADLVVEELLDAGADGALVNLGGDLRVAGTGPDGGAWGVAVEHPDRGHVADLALVVGAVATSTPRRRRWVHRGGIHHHVIDPATGRPARELPAAVTVVAGEAWRAEVLATAALLTGPDGLCPLLTAWGATALLSPPDDDPVTLAGMEEYLR